jgi:hypothetical protein
MFIKTTLRKSLRELFENIFISNFFAADLKFLETQEIYAKEILQFLETLEPGETWKKYQLLAKLKGLLLNQAKVSLLIQVSKRV